MYSSLLIDLWDFGALDFMEQSIYCFNVKTNYCNVFVFKINLN